MSKIIHKHGQRNIIVYIVLTEQIFTCNTQFNIAVCFWVSSFTRYVDTQKDLKEILPAVSITLFLIILLFYPFTVRFFCYFVGKQGGLSFGLPLGF